MTYSQVQCCDQLSSQGLENKVLWDGKTIKPHNHALKKTPCTKNLSILGYCEWVFCDLNYYCKAPRQALTEESPPPVQLLHTDAVELPHLGDLCLVLSEGQLHGGNTGSAGCSQDCCSSPPLCALSSPGIVLLTHENFPIVPL